MDEFKEKFAAGGERILLPKHDVGPFYVMPRENGWKESLILGTYNDLSHLRNQLRVSEKLQNELEAIGVRYGLRSEDRSPLLGKQVKLPERESNTEILALLVASLTEKWGHARDGEINPGVEMAFATKSLQAITLSKTRSSNGSDATRGCSRAKMRRRCSSFRSFTCGTSPQPSSRRTASVLPKR